MRAGCFAERRVIDLFNRRFVPFYFNRSGNGAGSDPAASAFVAQQTANPYAYLAAFSSDGKLLGETDLYADKDAVFDWALQLLRDHPQFAAPTMGERKLRADADALDGNRLAVADLDEELGDYDAAVAGYGSLLESGDPAVARRAGVALLRIARYRGRWDEHQALEADLRERLDLDEATLFDFDLEHGRRMLGTQELGRQELGTQEPGGPDGKDARAWLQQLTRRAQGHPRCAEAHFYAGVACWSDNDRPWAKFHWCWIGERLKADRLWRRAYIAAAAEGMPYANPELGGYAAPVGSIGVGDIIRAYGAAAAVYQALLPLYEQGALDGAAPKEARSWAQAAGEAPELVAQLRDGNAHVRANNLLVERLVELGIPAVEPLVAAIQERSFEGRGYAGWALGLVLASLAEPPQAAIDALDLAATDADSYVSTLSRSGRNQLRAATAATRREAAPRSRLPRSAFELVAGLVDGNAHLEANNARVEALVGLGEAGMPALLAAMGETTFPGRGYAGWALSQVLAKNALDRPAAVEALRQAAEDEDAYVSALARSGLSTLK